MCLMCETAAPAFGEFGMTERPSEELRGVFWEGSHEEAAAGAVRAMLKRVQAHCGAGKASLWDGPIVGVSWSTGPGRFRTFVGIESATVGTATDAGLETLTLPGHRYATAWHGAEDGDVVERYGRMIEWIRMAGHARSPDGPHHREEYPRESDFDATPVLRLMLPVT
ncbi:GyrI-like domain-containing protein [Aquibium oceanicum]|uniref:GyrI-like small molecule binding domain-containing protein n=1 Tax=Aquibium oceanicum TaxID=1670800 RepID=A0A1L3SRG4_9HYPH|nr:GyrI-like domain-containing protein [Aquibium oceanicum]APH71994.1 hypothetical protein BSQ44_11940 [Aquibium oceanicum]